MFENAQDLHRTPFLPTRCPPAYNWTTKWTTGRFLSRGGRAKNQKVSNFPGNLARPPRLERGTLCLEGRCSIQLSYGRLARRLAAAACSRKFAQRASYETARYWQCHAAPAHARDLRLSLETPGWPNKPQAANALQAAG